MNKIFLLIISGSVGVGKTSVADAVSEILSSRSIPNAVIDLDHLRSAYPRPSDDPFHMALGYKNLAAIWPNYKEAGIAHLIIPNVTESRKELGNVKLAVPDADIKVVRLRAPVKTIHRRLRNRDTGDSLEWHLKRAVELNEKLEQEQVEDFVVDTENKPVKAVAEEILSKSGWLDQGRGHSQI